MGRAYFFVMGVLIGLVFHYGSIIPPIKFEDSKSVMASNVSIEELRKFTKIESIPTDFMEYIPKKLGPYKWHRTGVMHASLTAYNAFNYDPKTSTGKIPIPGRTVAVDPKVIPYGSKVFIPGIGWRIAEDSGGIIKGSKIDIFVDSEDAAYKFGRRSELVLWMR